MFKRFLGNLVWLFSALGALHVGLIAMGYDIFMQPVFLTTLVDWVKPIQYIIGISGLLSLVMYFLAMISRNNCSCCCNGPCIEK
jgi:uncharacterized membrane protein YuzA (DUF378 family)